MKAKFRIISTCVVLLLSICLFSQIEMINNGDFESNTFPNNLTLCTNENLSDWTITLNEIDGIHDSWSSNNSWPDDTGWYIDLVGSCSSESSLAIIKSNSFDVDTDFTYNLTFLYGSSLALVDAKVSLRTALGDTLKTWLLTSPSINTWFNFIGIYNPLNSLNGCYLEFEGVLPPIDNGGMAIDNVSLIKEDTQVGIHENGFGSGLLLYPNPTFEKLNLSKDEHIQQLSIYDNQGRLVKSLRGNRYQIDVHDLSPGNYVLEVISANERHHFRFVKD